MKYDEIQLLQPGDRVRVNHTVPNPMYHDKTGKFVGAWASGLVGARKYRVVLDGYLTWVEFKPEELDWF